MFRSETITISIQRPHQAVYEFLAEPLNLPTWGPNLGSTIRHVSENDWVSETTEGVRVTYRYHERNDLGVLDHAVFLEGEVPFTVPMRIVANGDGAEVIYTLYQRPGMTEEAFVSEREWVKADLLTLKTLLESRSR